MSAPATKALLPEPVIIITLTELSNSRLLRALLISDKVSKLRAFKLSGLSIVSKLILFLFFKLMFLKFILIILKLENKLKK